MPRACGSAVRCGSDKSSAGLPNGAMGSGPVPATTETMLTQRKVFRRALAYQPHDPWNEPALGHLLDER